MWKNLAAGVFSVPTVNMPTTTIAQRLDLLRAALVELQNYRTARMIAAPGPKWADHLVRPSMVFIAPEYMFVHEGFQIATVGDMSSNRFMEKVDRQNTLNALQGISGGYGKQLVFVPGSIASRDPLSDIRWEAEEEVEGAIGRVRTGAEFVQGGIIGFQGKSKMTRGEAGDSWVNTPSISPRQKIRRLERILARRGPMMPNPGYLASNVAYLFHNGKPVAQYQKRGDYHEVMPLYGRDDTVYIPGIKSGRATVGGINFGIEICLDHGIGVLTNAPRVTPDLPRIHLICSAAVSFEPPNLLVREGGYLMHASSNLAWTTITRKLGGPQPPADPQEIAVGPGTLRMGTIELDM